ncbi:unnamed protein product, partial [Ectocarpus sp. 12 AP-2014]
RREETAAEKLPPSFCSPPPPKPLPPKNALPSTAKPITAKWYYRRNRVRLKNRYRANPCKNNRGGQLPLKKPCVVASFRPAGQLPYKNYRGGQITPKILCTAVPRWPVPAWSMPWWSITTQN